MAHFVDVVWFFPPICGSVQEVFLGINKEAGEAAGRQPTHPPNRTLLGNPPCFPTRSFGATFLQRQEGDGTTWSSYEADGVEPLGSWATGGRKVSLLLLREERRGKGIGLSYRSKPQLMDEYT